MWKTSPHRNPSPRPVIPSPVIRRDPAGLRDLSRDLCRFRLLLVPIPLAMQPSRLGGTRRTLSATSMPVHLVHPFPAKTHPIFIQHPLQTPLRVGRVAP